MRILVLNLIVYFSFSKALQPKKKFKFSTIIDRFLSFSLLMSLVQLLQLFDTYIFGYKSLSMQYFSLITYDCWKEDTNKAKKKKKNMRTVFWSAENGTIKEASLQWATTKETQTWRSKAITFGLYVISWCITESWKLTLQQKIQLKLDDKVDISSFSSCMCSRLSLVSFFFFLC